MRRLFLLTIIAMSLLLVGESFAASSQVYDKRSIGFGTLTNGKYCIWDNSLKKVVCNSEGGASTTVIDALNSTSSTAALSANQGKVLSEGKVPIPTASIDDGLLLIKDGTGTTGKFKAGGVPITMTSDTTGAKYYDTTADTWESGSYALTPVIDDPDNFAANFTGANLYGGTFIANAAGTAALPDPAPGMNFTYVLEGANANVIEPLSTGTDDTIVLNGTALTQGHNITSSTSGAMCVFQYRAANSWMATCNGFVDGT